MEFSQKSGGILVRNCPFCGVLRILQSKQGIDSSENEVLYGKVAGLTRQSTLKAL